MEVELEGPEGRAARRFDNWKNGEKEIRMKTEIFSFEM